jgi:hypothetical protein
MNLEGYYKYLELRPGDIARQPFLKGIKIRADTLFSDSIEHIEDDGSVTPGQTPEEIAENRNLPLEVVREALDWCQKNLAVLLADRARENRLMDAQGMNHPDYKYHPSKYRRTLTPEEERRILNDEDLLG